MDFFQFLTQLFGKVDNAAIVSAGGAAVIEWEYATEVKRSWPLVTMLASTLDLTEVQLDSLFTLAATK